MESCISIFHDSHCLYSPRQLLASLLLIPVFYLHFFTFFLCQVHYRYHFHPSFRTTTPLYTSFDRSCRSVVNMKYSLYSVAFIASFVAALPNDLVVRQSTRVGSTANEFKNGGCKDVVMVFARGSTEAGNMVCIIKSTSSTAD